MIPVTYRQDIWVVTEATLIEVGDFAIKIPEGFTTDLASVPRFLWVLFPPFGKYQDAAIMHDYLLDFTVIPKRQVDLLFYEKMKLDGVHLITRFIFYCVVNIMPRL